MNKGLKISLGFLISGSVITLVSTPLFIISGVGVNKITIPTSNGSKEISSGYFSYQSNFELVKETKGFDETTASDKGYSFDFYGFAQYMIEKINNNDLPSDINPPGYVEIQSLEDIKAFYENVVLNMPLFITSAVLLPIGLTTSFISLPIFITFKRKG